MPGLRKAHVSGDVGDCVGVTASGVDRSRACHLSGEEAISTGPNRLTCGQIELVRDRRRSDGVAVEDLPADPQVSASGIFVESDHPIAGRVREARPAPRFSATPACVGGPAPRIGEHTREILAEIGLAADTEALLEDGVVTEPA